MDNTFEDMKYGKYILYIVKAMEQKRSGWNKVGLSTSKEGRMDNVFFFWQKTIIIKDDVVP